MEQPTKEELEEQIKELEEQIKELKNKNNWIKITLSTGKVIEVEKELHKDIQYIRDIKIPEEQRLLELWEFIELLNNHREEFWGKGNGDEWINQPVNLAKKDYPFMNVWFDWPGDGSRLSCWGGCLDDDGRAFGVRFVKELGELK